MKSIDLNIDISDLLPAGGGERKMIQRIDRRICPEAYNSNAEAEESAKEK